MEAISLQVENHHFIVKRGGMVYPPFTFSLLLRRLNRAFFGLALGFVLVIVGLIIVNPHGAGVVLAGVVAMHGMESAPLRVAIYIRVSSEEQAKEGYSLQAQLRRLRLYAEAHGWVVVEEYADEGYSGRNLRRAGYQRMMQEKDKWDLMLVLKMDRIHRNQRNFTNMMDQLKQSGKEFASATESLDTSTPGGRFVMDILQLLAQLESEQISERVKMGMEQKEQQEKGTALSNVPLGYKILDGRIEVDDAAASLVRRMFQLAKDGLSAYGISQLLTKEGIPTRTGLRNWSAFAVRSVLRNRCSLGERHWGGHVKLGNHAAIIDEATFLEVQRHLDALGATYRPDVKPSTAQVPSTVWAPPKAEARVIPKPRGSRGSVPYGYEVVYGAWTPDPAEARVVQSIFAQAVAGVAPPDIARALNRDGIPSPGGRSWTTPRVYVILENVHYIGQRLNQGQVLAGYHVPLVSPEQFAAAQPHHPRKAAQALHDAQAEEAGSTAS
jgi:site-specific DNA recombinase